MLYTKLTETNENLKSEIQNLKDKCSESEKKKLASLNKEITEMKTNFEKLKLNDQQIPLGACVPDKTGSTTNPPLRDFSKCIIIEGVTESPN